MLYFQRVPEIAPANSRFSLPVRLLMVSESGKIIN